jgi:hypothetical protein
MLPAGKRKAIVQRILPARLSLPRLSYADGVSSIRYLGLKETLVGLAP